MAQPTPAERVTVGELGRRFDEFREDFHRSIDGIHRRLDELQFVPLAVFEEYRRTAAAERTALAKDITDLRADLESEKARGDANRRLAITAFVGPLIVGIALAVILAAMNGGPG